MAAIADVLERHDVNMLLIDAGASRIEVFDQLADMCLDLPLRVCELTQFYEDVLGHVPVTEIESTWFRYIMHPRFRSTDRQAKRALDLAVVLVAGAVFLPVLGLCALLIKLHDGGPVLFRQRRIGTRGREFTVLKLRTMRTGPAVARWSSSDDERVTPIGRLLRRTHLDELPQLVNVLRGEMSVVGPRPEQPEFVERLEHTLPYYSRRHLIKPGLTGWAQVRCGYAGSDTGSAWKLCHDLFYLKHQSLGFDLAILGETARTLVADRQFSARGKDGSPPLVAMETRGRPGSCPDAEFSTLEHRDESTIVQVSDIGATKPKRSRRLLRMDFPVFAESRPLAAQAAERMILQCRHTPSSSGARRSSWSLRAARSQTSPRRRACRRSRCAAGPTRPRSIARGATTG